MHLITASSASVQRRPFALKCASAALAVGMLFSAPFAFFPKSEVIGMLAFMLTSIGLAMAGSLRRLNAGIAVAHIAAIVSALALFFYHSLDLLYIKFMLSVVISFQMCLADRGMLYGIRDGLLYYGARGAVLAIASFVMFFAFDFSPFYRTLLGDERAIPFFGLTNINFGFNNPEILIFARPAFLFDEPGQFAHFVLLLLALIATSGHSRSRWRKETGMLVLSGLATFSLAFFIVAGIYLATKVFRWKTWLLLGGMCMVAALLWDNPLFEALQSRFNPADTSINDDNRAASGDNRTREVKLAYEAFIENPLWGAGWSAADRSVGHFAANPLGPLGYSGLMALLLYWPFLQRLWRCATASRNFNQRLIIFLVLLFFSQRPYFYFPLFVFLVEVMRRQMLAARKSNPALVSAKDTGCRKVAGLLKRRQVLRRPNGPA